MHAQLHAQTSPYLRTGMDLVIILATGADQPAGVQRLKVAEGAVVGDCGVCCSLLGLCLLKSDAWQQRVAQHQVAGLQAVNHHLRSSSSSSSSRRTSGSSSGKQAMYG
jgi:hypothetical protein